MIGDVRIPGRVLSAPMTGISDLPYRRAASRLDAAYVATEMVACEAFAHGRPDVVRRAAVGDGLPLMVIQLVGREPRWIAQGAATAEAAGAQIIDLNMGCPSKLVTGALSGSALMRDLDLAERLIAAAVSATSRPVTLKIRLGWDRANMNAPELAVRAERAGVKGITVHGRTRQQFYGGQADWRAVAAVKAAVTVPVIVNGDVVDVGTARLALAESGADAVMIGRAVADGHGLHRPSTAHCKLERDYWSLGRWRGCRSRLSISRIVCFFTAWRLGSVYFASIWAAISKALHGYLISRAVPRGHTSAGWKRHRKWPRA
jgi:nifR3 family TIM-barrel protein